MDVIEKMKVPTAPKRTGDEKAYSPRSRERKERDRKTRLRVLRRTIAQAPRWTPKKGSLLVRRRECRVSRGGDSLRRPRRRYRCPRDMRTLESRSLNPSLEFRWVKLSSRNFLRRETIKMRSDETRARHFMRCEMWKKWLHRHRAENLVTFYNFVFVRRCCNAAVEGMQTPRCLPEISDAKWKELRESIDLCRRNLHKET